MHIDHLSLKNFICFDETETTFVGPLDTPVDDLIPRLTVVLGKNGGGKSATLKAVAIALLGPELDDTLHLPTRHIRVNSPKATLGRIPDDYRSYVALVGDILFQLDQHLGDGEGSL